MSGTSLRRLQLAGFALMLTLGLLAGLARLGWISAGALAGQHGPLMICAGLGSLIGIERAAASSWRLAWLAPGFSLTGGLMLLLGGSAQAAGLAFLAAALAQIRLLLPARPALPLLLQLGGLPALARRRAPALETHDGHLRALLSLNKSRCSSGS